MTACHVGAADQRHVSQTSFIPDTMYSISYAASLLNSINSGMGQLFHRLLLLSQGPTAKAARSSTVLTQSGLLLLSRCLHAVHALSVWNSWGGLTQQVHR